MVVKIQKFVVVYLVLMGLFQGSLLAKNFDNVANAIITKAVKTQPRNSYLRKMYQISGNRPIWITQFGLTPIAKQLLRRVTRDPLVDRRTKLYKNAKMILEGDLTSSPFGGKNSTSKHMKLEFKLSRLFRNYANYSIYGMIHWGHFKILFKRQAGLDDVYADWEIYPVYTVYSLLRKIIRTGDLNEPFNTLTPKTRLYQKLNKKFNEYREIALDGTWPKVPPFAKITVGQNNNSIPYIRKRLSVSGDLRECRVTDSILYDQCLFNAVKRFQKRNGLIVDGVLGSATAKMISQSVGQMLTRIKLNLDRIKMMKRNDVGKHIMVNIPAFELYFYDGGKIINSMRVVTGSKGHPTPIFSDEVETVVLNPYWNVPTSIIQKEMIPKLLRNKNAMKRQGIEVRDGWGPNAKKISPNGIDWKKYQHSKGVPYRFAQVPGNRNALGRIKFLFPNKFSVYMHDTPQKHLFKRHTRAFSHGCIRLQNPRGLLKTFSSFNSRLDYDKAKKILKTKKQTYINLNQKVPVDVVYLTAWVDPSGILQLRNDIYGYDRMQLKYRRRY
jgi:murein L,D-transpeptidase YcbB/YkuD